MEFRALGRQRNSKLNIGNKSTVRKKGRPCEGELVPSSLGQMLSLLCPKVASSLWMVGSGEAELLEIREEKHSPYVVECFTEWMTSHSYLILLTHLGKRIG